MSNHQGFEVVLVVDDNGAVLSMTELMLTRHGYRAIVCQSGTQAIDLVRDWPELEIEVALVDVVLGDISGTDVAKEILRYKPDLPIIFMTEFPEHHEVLALQGQTVFKKPFTSLLMIQTIRGLLGREGDRLEPRWHLQSTKRDGSTSQCCATSGQIADLQSEIEAAAIAKDSLRELIRKHGRTHGGANATSA